jgi:hypothetical protein
MVEVVTRRILVLDAAAPNEKKVRSIERGTTDKHAEVENVSSEIVSASGEIDSTAE